MEILFNTCLYIITKYHHWTQDFEKSVKEVHKFQLTILYLQLNIYFQKLVNKFLFEEYTTDFQKLRKLYVEVGSIATTNFDPTLVKF